MILAQFIAICSSAKTFAIGENLLSLSRPDLTPTGEAQPCQCSHPSTSSSTPTRVKLTSIRCGGQSYPAVAPVPEPRRRSPGGRTTSDPGVNAPGVMAASAPSTTSLHTLLHPSRRSLAYWILATFLLVCRVRRGVWPESWASRAGPVIAGAGGYGRRPGPTRPSASEQAGWKRMSSRPLLGTKAKPNQAGPSR